MNDKKLWSLIAKLNWAQVQKNAKQQTAHSVRLIQRHTEAELKELKAFVTSRYNELSSAVSDYENKTGKTTGCGDDGFSDLIHHIVGLGEAAFNAAMKRPGLVIARAQAYNYTESFAYMLHTDQFKEDLQPSKYVKWAIKEYPAIKAKVAQCTDLKQTKELNQVLDVLQNIAYGNFQIPAFCKRPNAYRELEQLTGNYSVSNLLGDLDRYAEFFNPKDIKALVKPIGIPVTTPPTFDRASAVARLEKALSTNWNKPSIQKQILTHGHVPYSSRSNAQLAEDLREMANN